MDFLYFLESIRNPVLDAIMSVITYLGDEIAFLALSLAVYWCISKKRGYYLLSVGFCGVIINQVLKLCFRIPRPWVLDPNFKPIESAVPAATGYSFPSGHTQNVTCTFGGVARFSKTLWIRIASIAVIVLVAFSRMYLGVHTPLDVGVSLVIGAVLVFALYPLFEYANKHENAYYWIFGSFFVIALGFLAFALIFPKCVTLDPEHSNSALKNACTILGATAGMLVAYPLDRHVVKFNEKAPIAIQIAKLAIGLILVLAIKEGCKALFTIGVEQEHFLLRALRYFLVVVFAGGIYPMTFKLYEYKNYVPVFKYILRLIFTFGIWQYVWIYNTTSFTNLETSTAKRNPTNKLLLCIFVPFYTVYWAHITAKGIDKMAQNKHIASNISTLCTILAVFAGPVSAMIMQSKINQIVKAR